MKGQVVLITGGATGIGAATVQAPLAKGAIPVLLDCHVANLAATNASLGGKVLTFCLDVSDYAACQVAVDQTIAAHGRIDVVWANAGIASFGPLQLTDLNAFKRCALVNVFGTLNTVRTALPAVIAQRLRIGDSLGVQLRPPSRRFKLRRIQSRGRGRVQLLAH